MRSSLPGIFSICTLTALNWASSVAADYYVDNANNTVAYAASGTVWQTFSFATQNITFVLGNGNVTVDSSKCYDQNFNLVAACTVENNCQITFPFTGSGLSVYVVQAGFQGVNAKLTIDGGQSVTATLHPPTPPSYQTPNVLLFDLQSLPSADHTATINLLNWQNGTTSLYFDYALVNESHVQIPVSPPTTSPSPITSMTTTLEMLQSSTIQSTTASLTSVSTFIGSSHTSGTSSTASTAKHRANLGAVVGGACGGLAILIAIVTAILFFKKRRLRHVQLEESRRPDPFPVAPVLAHDQIVSSRGRPTMSEKMHVRLAARSFPVHPPSNPSDGGPSPFPIVPALGHAERAVAAETGHAFSGDDVVIDVRREDRSHSNSRVQNTPSSTAQVGSAP
ncbi:hypothetical protein L210DRAFT_3633417, partial [Boletus edulis BED1]